MKKGAIKMSVMYPNEKGKKFDMDYYLNKHIPMLEELLGEGVIALSLDKGISGALPGSSATYHVIANMYFETIEDFQNSFGPNARKISSDVVNYTDIKPVAQISEVVISK